MCARRNHFSFSGGGGGRHSTRQPLVRNVLCFSALFYTVALENGILKNHCGDSDEQGSGWLEKAQRPGWVWGPGQMEWEACGTQQVASAGALLKVWVGSCAGWGAGHCSGGGGLFLSLCAQMSAGFQKRG